MPSRLYRWLGPIAYRQAVLHCIEFQDGFGVGKLGITFPATQIGGRWLSYPPVAVHTGGPSTMNTGNRQVGMLLGGYRARGRRCEQY